jgi:glycosyltransferase involved in cell wall biosynthesis
MTATSSNLPVPIKLLRVIARLNIGGPAVHVALLTAGINDAAFRSVLVAGQIGPREGDMAYFARERGVEPVIIPELGREISPLTDLIALWALIRLIRKERPHIVHTHTAKAGFVGRLAAWLCGVPVIIHTFHGHTFHSYFGALTTQVFIWLERLMGSVSTVILTLSETLRNDLLTFRIAPPDKIRIAPLLLNLAEFTESNRFHATLSAELALPKDAQLIGIVGRLVPIKNHTLFLQAARRVVEKAPHARFVIVGDGERRVGLESFAEQQGLTNAVRFVGWRRDLVNIYASLDVLALTSNNEGTPVSLIEAMAAGVPVVSTRVGGVPDLLGNGERGTLVDAGDEEALANGIIDVLEHPDKSRIQRAQTWVLNEHGAERNIARMRELYIELLKAKGIG